jgi:hypothetical protein
MGETVFFMGENLNLVKVKYTFTRYEKFTFV